MLKKFLILSGALFVLAGCASMEPDDPNRVKGEYTVALLPHALGSRPIEMLYKDYGPQIKQISEGKYHVRLAKDPGPKKVQAIAADSAEVASVQPVMKAAK